MAARLLEKHGHRVVVASNGVEAVEAAARGEFNLVLMDVQMPDMGGFEATRILRSREQGSGRHLPIVAMTAHAMKGDRERCMEAGMDAYVAKPIKAAELLETIDRVTAASFVPAGETQRDAAGRIPVFDAAAVVSRVDGDMELLAELRELFVESRDAQVAELRALCDAGAAEPARRAAHSLKGAVASLGGVRAESLALEIETRAGRGELDTCRAAIPELESSIAELTLALDAFLSSRLARAA
jgi:CheY-like chemotaxis protein/HPt (histidine-containing phosphotransfer) domain-containing protein